MHGEHSLRSIIIFETIDTYAAKYSLHFCFLLESLFCCFLRLIGISIFRFYRQHFMHISICIPIITFEKEEKENTNRFALCTFVVVDAVVVTNFFQGIFHNLIATRSVFRKVIRSWWLWWLILHFVYVCALYMCLCIVYDC